MWKLTIEDDQANKTVVHLAREEYGLGRGEGNAVRLTERNISRRHALIQRSGEAWVLKDLSSYNGTYVNNQRVGTSHDLAHSDVVQVGDYRIIVEDEALSANPNDIAATVPAPRGTSGGATVDRFVVLVGPNPGAEIPLTPGRMVIGRGEDCDIAINHASVSRTHAELHSAADGRYEIIDKDSANGVRVNGVELPKSFIDARDVIELGDVIMKFIPAGETYVPAADESLQIAAIGASRRQEADEGLVDGLKSSVGLKVGLAVGLSLMLGLLAVVALGRRPATSELVSVKDEVTARADRALAEAKQLLDRGDVSGAYEKAGAIPAGASARESSVFRRIQSAYADLLFEQAEKTEDLADKRGLLDQIAKSPSIDGARRNRAAELLNELSAQAVNVRDLPSTKLVPADPSASSRRVAGPPPTDPNARVEPESATTEAVALPPALAPQPPKPAPARSASSPRGGSAATPAKSGPTTLVRETPF
jgi:pSer/pThr/pTyr-binding forkhead associated (FHA) protein